MQPDDALDLAAPPVTRESDQSALTPGGVITRRGGSTPFEVHLDNFSGPFDLLLGLISKHKLDITEIALAKVTDEFIAHIKAAQSSDTEWDLGQASEFLLIAATLLDIKSARLLPQTGPQDEEDLALIEARDLLFARLLQYRAFKDIAFTFGERMATAGRMTPRQAGLEPQFARLLPELIMGITPEQLAMIAARAMVPKIAAERRHGPPARPAGQRARAGRHHRGQAAGRTGLLVPGAGRRRRLDAGHRGPVPGAARAVPRVGDRLRAGRVPRRARRSAGPATTRARSRSATSSTRATSRATSSTRRGGNRGRGRR